MHKYFIFLIICSFILVGCGKVDETFDGINAEIPSIDENSTEIEIERHEQAVEEEEALNFGWIKMSEVVKHNHAADCWLVVHDQVFAMTVFVNNHPGGQVWAPKCGQNATELFEDNLTNFEATILDDYYVGDLHP